MLVRFGGGASASAVLSQVSSGRRGSVAWDGERPEELWLGHRGRANETLLRDPLLLAEDARTATILPAGHAEGYPDTFRELNRAVYRDVVAGGPADEPTYPTFRDGHRANVLAEAVGRSARAGTWIDV